MSGSRVTSTNPRLVATMSVTVLTVAVLQTGVVPILGVMSDQLGVSLADVSWTVTANLLAAAATTPLDRGGVQKTLQRVCRACGLKKRSAPTAFGTPMPHT